MDVHPNVALVADCRFASVEPYPDPYVNAIGPSMVIELPLDGHCRRGRRGTYRENGEELIGPGINFATPMLTHDPS